MDKRAAHSGIIILDDTLVGAPHCGRPEMNAENGNLMEKIQKIGNKKHDW